MPVEAQDLIDRLMQLDPFQRLGAGPPGSDNQYEQLKAHPFFKGINFKNLSQISPPVPYERFKAAMEDFQKGPS